MNENDSLKYAGILESMGFVKGNEDNSVSQLIMEPLGVHSEKPAVTRDRIKALLGGDLVKGIELFARTTADGWDCWGNEVFDAREAARQRRRKKVNQ